MRTKLNLRIHSVKCKDETGGSFREKSGDDEIFPVGFSVDPNGQTAKVAPFNANSDFHEGNIKKFSPAIN